MHPRINGVWAAEVSPFSRPVIRSRWDGGCVEASWQHRSGPHSALKATSLVQIFDGAIPVWAGQIREYDPDSGVVSCVGLSAEATALAVDSTGAATAVPDTALSVAVSRGALRWVVPVLSSVPWSDLSDGVSTIDTMLNALARQYDRHWGVGPDRTLYWEATPTAPRWHIAPGVVRLALAEDDYASHLYGTYDDGTATPKVATVGDAASAARWGRQERSVDLTPMGAITLATAQGVLTSMLSRGMARPQYSGPLELTAGQLINPGGSPAHLPSVRAGQLVRVHGLYDETVTLGGATYVDLVIGECTYQAGAATVSLTPQGAPPRTLAEVLRVAAS